MTQDNLDGYQGETECSENEIFYDATNLSESEKAREKVHQACTLFVPVLKHYAV